MFDLMLFIVVLVATFFIGSIPSGFIISKFMYHTDVRDKGSGNIGTTNVMRTLGTKAGIIVFIMDFCLGLFSGLFGLGISNFMQGGGFITQNDLLAASFLGSVSGHIFCPWLGFKGGKGIATAVGNLFITFGPVGALLELAVFAVLLLITRRVSVGSLGSSVTCPFFALYFFWGDWLAVVCCAIAACCAVWAHRNNIKRLMNGTEPKMGEKKKQQQEAQQGARKEAE